MAKRFGIMLDMSRNAVMRPAEVKAFAKTAKALGYNMLQLYTEDTYEVEGEPYFGYLRGRYSVAEMKDMVAYCDSIGVEVIPCVQTLAHLNQIFNWKDYAAIRDIDDILLIDDPRTYELIENMIRTLRQCFTTDVLHIGMDEAHMVGLGKFLDRNGVQGRFDILHRHLEKVVAICRKYNFHPIMWSDMFFRLANHGAYVLKDPDLITDEVVAACPAGVDVVYWDYYQNQKSVYDTMLDAHKKFGREVWFAGGAWTWSGFAPSNAWSLDTMLPAMQSCRERNVDNIFITMWGDDGKECSFWSVLPALFAIRKFHDGVTDMDVIKSEFKALTGEDFDGMMLLDLPMDLNINRKSPTPHKYWLYADPLLGYTDPVVPEGLAAKYTDMAERLTAAAVGSSFAYVFESQAALCRLLAVKHDLGVRTRAAYQAGDKKALAALLEDFTAALSLLGDFHAAFAALWHKENKPHGFDVQELRLGGLMLRLASSRDRLAAYLSGELEKIEELEEALLPFRGTRMGSNGKLPDMNKWRQSVSPNVI